MNAIYPGVGSQASSGDECRYTDFQDRPLCNNQAEWHLLAEDFSYGLVGLSTCEFHRSTAEQAGFGDVRSHRFAGDCAASGHGLEHWK